MTDTLALGMLRNCTLVNEPTPTTMADQDGPDKRVIAQGNHAQAGIASQKLLMACCSSAELKPTPGVRSQSSRAAP